MPKSTLPQLGRFLTTGTVSLEGDRVDPRLYALWFKLPLWSRRRQKSIVNVEKNLAVIIFFSSLLLPISLLVMHRCRYPTKRHGLGVLLYQPVSTCSLAEKEECPLSPSQMLTVIHELAGWTSSVGACSHNNYIHFFFHCVYWFSYRNRVNLY